MKYIGPRPPGNPPPVPRPGPARSMQPDPPPDPRRELLGWVVALGSVGLALYVGGSLVLRLRRRMFEGEEQAEEDRLELLDALRRAHQLGEIDDLAYARAREKLGGLPPAEPGDRPGRPGKVEGGGQ